VAREWLIKVISATGLPLVASSWEMKHTKLISSILEA